MKEASESYGFIFEIDFLWADPVLKKLNVRSGERVLEIGCNKGMLLRKLQKRNVDAIGIDVNKKAVQKKVVDEVYEMNAENLKFKNESFDKIYSVHTIEHIPNLKKAFKEMDRVLKPGGRIVLIYPAEPIRGLFVVLRALFVYGNPLKARKIHLHKLNPKKIKGYIKGTKLKYIESGFPIPLTPQYLTVLEKE
ncbi:MAG: class I SAM-dependent methyltransferase [Patescibacteria group bacterium]|nr:class I SAM-dependent methyltransferase [Patescibacteria group bacterium]